MLAFGYLGIKDTVPNLKTVIMLCNHSIPQSALDWTSCALFFIRRLMSAFKCAGAVGRCCNAAMLLNASTSKFTKGISNRCWAQAFKLNTPQRTRYSVYKPGSPSFTGQQCEILIFWTMYISFYLEKKKRKKNRCTVSAFARRPDFIFSPGRWPLST